MPLGVGQQPVDASGDMPQVKGDGSYPFAAKVEFVSGQSAAPMSQVNSGQLQCMQHRARHGRNFG